jgi:hypothetical protein
MTPAPRSRRTSRRAEAALEKTWWRKLPPQKHPFWTMVQGSLSLVALAIVLLHTMLGRHENGLDVTDGVGAIGLASAARVMWQLAKRG